MYSGARIYQQHQSLDINSNQFNTKWYDFWVGDYMISLLSIHFQWFMQPESYV